MSLHFPTFSKNSQKKSAGTSVLNAAIRTNHGATQEAAARFLEATPPVRRIANVMMHIPEGRSGSRHFTKSVRNSALHSGSAHPYASRPERLHAHEVMRKYNKPIQNGIIAHKAVYGGSSLAAEPVSM